MLQTNTTVTNNAFSRRILNLVSLIVPATFFRGTLLSIKPNSSQSPRPFFLRKHFLRQNSRLHFIFLKSKVCSRFIDILERKMTQKFLGVHMPFRDLGNVRSGTPKFIFSNILIAWIHCMTFFVERTGDSPIYGTFMFAPSNREQLCWSNHFVVWCC